MKNGSASGESDHLPPPIITNHSTITLHLHPNTIDPLHILISTTTHHNHSSPPHSPSPSPIPTSSSRHAPYHHHPNHHPSPPSRQSTKGAFSFVIHNQGAFGLTFAAKGAIGLI
nr:hypothetical protein [Tanacetum cinerariifolium]